MIDSDGDRPIIAHPNTSSILIGSRKHIIEKNGFFATKTYSSTNMIHNFFRTVRFLTSPMNFRSSVVLGVLTLGCGAAVWGIEAIVAPVAVQAYTARIEVMLDRTPNETYEGMVRRAELVARTAAQRGFDRDLLANEVSVVVVGRNGGMAAPVVTLWVTRSQWQERPETRRWATYYRNLATLLGF